MESRGAGTESDPTVNVDAAALVLAAIAGALVLVTGPGEWSALELIMGLLLAVIVLAFHVPVRAHHSSRRWLQRLAFGGVMAVAAVLITGWPLDAWFNTDLTSNLGIWAIVPLAVAGALLEGPISRWLGPLSRH
jgi:hypothetical protein